MFGSISLALSFRMPISINYPKALWLPVECLCSKAEPPKETKKPAAKNKWAARPTRRVPMDPHKMAYANTLKTVQTEAASLTTMNQVDMKNWLNFESSYGREFESKHGVKPDYVSAFCKAAVYAMKMHPVVNAFVIEKEVVYRHYIDMGITVATPKEILTAVIKHIESMSFPEISKTLVQFRKDAESNSLDAAVLTEGTFTVVDEGAFGSVLGTGLLRASQTASLIIHNIIDRPVSVDKKLEIRPMVYVGMTYDHRIIDGREAVFFLKDVKKALEEPKLIYENSIEN